MSISESPTLPLPTIRFHARKQTTQASLFWFADKCRQTSDSLSAVVHGDAPKCGGWIEVEGQLWKNSGRYLTADSSMWTLKEGRAAAFSTILTLWLKALDNDEPSRPMVETRAARVARLFGDTEVNYKQHIEEETPAPACAPNCVYVPESQIETIKSYLVDEPEWTAASHWASSAIERLFATHANSATSATR